MEIICGVKHFSKDKYPGIVIGIGNFDGVHSGHKFIIQKIVKRAKATHRKSLIFTFPVHPLNVLKEKGWPLPLTTLSQKLILFCSLGVDICLLEDFNQEFAERAPYKFVREILKESLGVKEIFIGENYRFGRGRRGKIKDLIKWGKRWGFKVRVLPLIQIKKELVSSTRIRELIKAGQVASASQLLGRPYTISGQVVKGRQRGISLGFPTANIEPNLSLILKDGVYVVEIEENGKNYRGLLNLGKRPTFDEHKRILEVHLFNYSGSLYGQEVWIKVLQRLRDELKFDSSLALINQIREDIKEAKEFFEKN